MIYHIYNFCKDAERIFGSTDDTLSINRQLIKLNLKKDEIWRTRYSKDGSCIFDFSLGFNNMDILDKQIQYMNTIELFYPDTFTWIYDGKNIKILGLIPMKKDNLGIFSRYGGINSFILYLRRQLCNVLKYREFNGIIEVDYIDNKIISLGSLNKEMDTYVVNILPSQNKYEILTASKYGKITDTTIKEFNMRYWVKEINPDFFKEVTFKPQKKHPISADIFTKYPPCIKKLAIHKKKGNYGRFLLGTFLLGVHHERDAKYQLDLMLNDEERTHINKGNCKDQWRTMVAKEYSPPSCKTMTEYGVCDEDCKQPRPSELVFEEEKHEKV